jgi:hypothetical protein
MSDLLSVFRPSLAPHVAAGDAAKRNYTGAFDCFSRIAREEGYRAFYKVAPRAPHHFCPFFHFCAGNGRQLSRGC